MKLKTIKAQMRLNKRLHNESKIKQQSLIKGSNEYFSCTKDCLKYSGNMIDLYDDLQLWIFKYLFCPILVIWIILMVSLVIMLILKK